MSEGSENFSHTETHRQGEAGNLEFFESVLTRTKIIACFEHYVISVKYQDRMLKKAGGDHGTRENGGSARFRCLINWTRKRYRKYMRISQDIHVTDIQQRTNNRQTRYRNRRTRPYGYRQIRPYGYRQTRPYGDRQLRPYRYRQMCVCPYGYGRISPPISKN